MSETISAEHRPLHVNKVPTWRALHWLYLGWQDFLHAPLVGLLHGGLMAAFGWGLLAVAADRFWVLAGAFSGFLLVAPILTTGLYAISRALLHGQHADLSVVVKVWASLDRRLVQCGLLLFALGTCWVVTSAALITLGTEPLVRTPADFLYRVVLAPEPGLFEVWLLTGGLMAAPIFASSVISIPLLVDRHVTLRCALRTSWLAVGVNPICLSVWAALVMGLTALGLASLMFGLLVVIPVLGHATWHAYRDMVAPETS